MNVMHREPAAMANPEALALWLADHADLRMAELHAQFCALLAQRGVPLWRSSLGLELLHPEQGGERLVWTVDGTMELNQAPQGVENSPDYLNSPVRIVDETNQPFRLRLTETVPDLPLLQTMRSEGATDYVIHPLRFLDTTRSAYMSFATKAPRGFTAADIATLEIATRLISPYAERRALRRIAVDLLDTYLGHHAGEQIFNGRIRRGAVETIEAAIMMCDMRAFTALANRAEQRVVIGLLNDWFERLETAVDANGGEILKFMGDGMLAIFRADARRAEACERAYAAAGQAGAALAGFSAACEACGEAPIGYAMGLHVGEVAYGNVGGRFRLDFTVLGPAVNYASRLEGLAKRLNRPILMSRDFAECLPGQLVPLGLHPLRGIGRAEQIYAAPGTEKPTDDLVRVKVAGEACSV